MKGQTNSYINNGIKGEKINLTVINNQNNPEDILGAKIKISYLDIEESYVWDGKVIVTEIPAYIEYTITCEDLINDVTGEGYKAPSQLSFCASVDSIRIVEVNYESCLMSIDVEGIDTDEAVGTISIDNKSTLPIYVGSNNWKIPLNSEVKINYFSIEGYLSPSPKETTAIMNNAQLSIEAQFKEAVLGVYIQLVDGSLVSCSDFEPYMTSNGVYVGTENAQFVIAKDQGQAWPINVSSVLPIKSEEEALLDFCGYENTLRLVEAGDTSYAAYMCYTYEFDNGKTGYLPSLGEINEAYLNKSQVDSAMSLIGGLSLSEMTTTFAPEIATECMLGTSSFYDYSRCFRFVWESGNILGYNNADLPYIRPFQRP